MHCIIVTMCAVCSNNIALTKSAESHMMAQNAISCQVLHYLLTLFMISNQDTLKVVKAKYNYICVLLFHIVSY